MLKKIETQEERDRKAKRNKIIISVVMVLLIGLSSLGYAIMSNSGDSSSGNSDIVQYSGLQFQKYNGVWATSINGKTAYFNSLPTEVQNASISGNYSLGDYYQKVVYIVNSNSAASSLYTVLDPGVFSIRVQDACLSREDCQNKDLPVKNCTNDYVFVFSASSSNKTSVYKEDNCVFISGDFFMGVDRLLYRLFNII
jgi:hypothetical protein